MGIYVPQMRKGMNQGAYSSKLTCPSLVNLNNDEPTVCGANKWKFVEKIGLYRARYRCGVCGKTIQYDYSNNQDHPYAVFGKNKWRRVVEAWKKKGMHPLS